MTKRGWIERRDGTRGASWRVRYWAPSATGELVPRSASFGERVYGTRRAAEDAAEAFLARMLTEVRAGTFIAPSSLTVHDLVDQWIRDREQEGRISGNTVHNYRQAIKHLRPSVAGVPVQQLKPMHLQTLYRQLRADGVGEGMLRQLHIVINGALAQAVQWEIVGRNVAQKVTKPAPQTPNIAYWTPDQASAFLAAEGDDPVYGVAWTLLVFTGMRCGELQALRWDDVDLVNASLRIARTATRTAAGKPVIGATTKTRNSRRTIPLPTACLDRLKAHRIAQRERELAAPVWDRSNGDLVFTRADGRAVSHTTLGQAFRRAVARTGLPPIKLHGLRHSVVTSLLLAGVHPKTAAELIGDSVAMVLKVYSHVTYDAKQTAIEDHASRLVALMDARRAAEQS